MTSTAWAAARRNRVAGSAASSPSESDLLPFFLLRRFLDGGHDLVAVMRLALLLDKVYDVLSLLVGDEGALDAGGLAGAQGAKSMSPGR
jgi:hypothetical protein